MTKRCPEVWWPGIVKMCFALPGPPQLWQTGGPGTKWNYAAMVSEHWNEPAPRSCDWNGDGLG